MGGCKTQRVPSWDPCTAWQGKGGWSQILVQECSQVQKSLYTLDQVRTGPVPGTGTQQGVGEGCQLMSEQTPARIRVCRVAVANPPSGLGPTHGWAAVMSWNRLSRAGAVGGRKAAKRRPHESPVGWFLLN